MNFFDGLDKEWFVANYPFIVLSVVVAIQWFALQALLIHYHFFRQSIKRPTPDGIRFSTIEKVLSFQASQLDRAFGKMSELSKEISAIPERRPVERPMVQSMPAIQPAFVSLGEMTLKKRLNELKSIAGDIQLTKTPKLN